MRLLNVHTLEFGEFFESKIPPYCILSHRWTENELSYKEFRKKVTCSGPGYQKIVDFCRVVRAGELPEPTAEGSQEAQDTFVSWVWVDTICIDKRSSAELSEAINSMFKWYEKAVQCYVYLSDVTSDCSEPHLAPQFRQSSWFLRGWTLQELLAPTICIFFNSRWQNIGHVCSAGCEGRNPLDREHARLYGSPLSDTVSEITTIPIQFLNRSRFGFIYKLSDASIAQRMSWASHRSATRVEDTAYCLLGVFGINMPLLYGEGEMAFVRLQEVIISRSTDPSIFAWWSVPLLDARFRRSSVLASSPRDFRESANVVRIPPFLMDEPTFELKNKGLQIEAIGITAEFEEFRGIFHDSHYMETVLLPLNCYNKTSDNLSLLHARPWMLVILRSKDKPYGKFKRRFLTAETQQEVQKLSIANLPTGRPKDQFLIEAYKDL